ncbi:uncharacterized protein LOC125521130 [Triticum urartu]|uniref:Uncharacterized protein n=3 Tax=Triticum TaxID=4564 RepID=A0A8R7P5C0_TRIUA|nr:uncharacterized protein LOC119269406 [Triticum dicoccoides]XP_044384284.1 uncharacterized protein LOC123106108 [Triticum aestivum]XP_048542161.1 uncharacterized protein LOC125521130 [Triticum urartu]
MLATVVSSHSPAAPIYPLTPPPQPISTPREKEREGAAGMNCVKILVLLSLIPLALRGASLLVVPSPSAPDSASRTGVLAPVPAEQWRQERRRTVGRQTRGGRATTIAPFAPRRFGGFFRDDKRFAPTGSNPLHNL